MEGLLLPSFETERLIVRPRSMADFDDCLAMDRDPEVTRLVPVPWDDAPSHERFLKERIEKSLGSGLGYWSIFPKQEPLCFAGWILLIPYDGVGPEIEIGWRLNHSSWGKGCATEAAMPIVRHAFETIGLPQIVADIDARNVGSMRVAEKIGMRLRGDTVQHGRPFKSYAMTKVQHLRAPKART